VLDKAHPSSAWIEQLRRKYPTEREVDRLMTRKMMRRAGPPFEPLSIDTLAAGIGSLLATQIDGKFEMTRVRWLGGGASKLQMAFDLDWTDGGQRQTRSMVLRMEPSESIVETSRLREFQVIKAMEGRLPVPPVFWVDAEGKHLPYPGLIYSLVEGVNKPTGVNSRVSALGVDLGARLRPLLSAQFMDHMALMHGLAPAELMRRHDFSAFDLPRPGTQAAEWQVNWWARAWEEDANSDLPLMDATESWMRDNLPSIDQLVLVHGDFRSGNFLFDETSGRITAWLDWELAHFGDFHEELAWVVARPFGHYAEDGKTFLVSGFFTEAEFLERYERMTGRKVDAKALKFYRVFIHYKCAVLAIATSWRVVRGGKTHQDSLGAWLIAIGYINLEEIRRLLEES
jgi:aminoglycoside phosphotransferase (APT) family kinase protein